MRTDLERLYFNVKDPALRRRIQYRQDLPVAFAATVKHHNTMARYPELSPGFGPHSDRAYYLRLVMEARAIDDEKAQWAAIIRYWLI